MVDVLPASAKKSILQKLSEGPVIGDGGFVFELEKRGYVKAGPWTPEATVEVRLFLIVLRFTFYGPFKLSKRLFGSDFILFFFCNTKTMEWFFFCFFCFKFPNAVKELHREFGRAGSDVFQTFTFYASEDKLGNWENPALNYGVKAVNDAFVRLVACFFFLNLWAKFYG